MNWSDLELLDKIGQGSSGEVFKARNHDKRTRDAHPFVAVKRYKGWVTEEPGQMERIVRELHVGRIVRHPNLVETLQLIFDDRKMPALVMKLYEGQTLEAFLKTKGYNICLQEIVHLSLGMALAIQALNRAGVIHRDIKPSNIMLMGREAILMDLGVIKPSEFPEQTVSGSFLGTIRYAAPEVLFGKQYDARADVYSLGLVIKEMISQRQYLHGISNWATLVVWKYQTHTYGEWWKHWTSRQFIERCSLEAAHFFTQLVSCIVCEVEKRQSIDWIVASLKSNLWNEIFHVKDGEYQKGAPIAKISIAENDRSLAEISEELLNGLKQDLRSKILRLIELEYPPSYNGVTNYKMCKVEDITEGEYQMLCNLAPYIIVEGREYGYTGAGWDGYGIRIHHCIFDLYRYGYLR